MDIFECPYVRAGRFRLLTISEHLNLVGVLPLKLNPGGRLETLGSMISDYLEPPIDPHVTRDVWEAICYALLRMPGIDVNVFPFGDDLPEGKVVSELLLTVGVEINAW